MSCVGKTTIGEKLAELLDVKFFDLDKEVEAFFGMSIERLQKKLRTMWDFRDEAAKALVDLLKRPESRDCVIALPPSGLMGPYLRAIKKSPGVTIALDDTPKNILKRISFYDIDSKLIEKQLTVKEKKWYLSEIGKNISYFGASYKRAHLRVDISYLTVEQAAEAVRDALEAYVE